MRKIRPLRELSYDDRLSAEENLLELFKAHRSNMQEIYRTLKTGASFADGVTITGSGDTDDPFVADPGTITSGADHATLSNLDYSSSGHTGFVQSNSAITSGTKTKITYDTKGLVTNGADATTADIADSVDRRYVTDAQLALLSRVPYVTTLTLTSGTTGSGATVDLAAGPPPTFDLGGVCTMIATPSVVTIPDSTSFTNNTTLMYWNGVRLEKAATTGLDVEFVSADKVKFNFQMDAGDTITIEMLY